MSHQIHPDVLSQLEGLLLDPSRPIIISDADEVIFAFVEGLEVHLKNVGMYLDLKSFALTGNIRHLANDGIVEATEVRGVIQSYFEVCTSTMPLIPDAVEHLNLLKGDAQIVVLTNIPLPHRQARADTLRQHGLDVPVVANIGLKGPAVAYLMARSATPAIFIDDIPHNLDSVRDDAPEVVRLHFIGDKRLAKLLGPAESSDARIDDWPNAITFIRDRINQNGR